MAEQKFYFGAGFHPLGGTLKNSVVMDRSDFCLDSEGYSYFEGILSACGIPEDKWPLVKRITIYLRGFSDVEDENGMILNDQAHKAKA